MDVNRISGYLPGKIVFFLMQASASVWGHMHASPTANVMDAWMDVSFMLSRL